jgi:hypothetical protein
MDLDFQLDAITMAKVGNYPVELDALWCVQGEERFPWHSVYCSRRYLHCFGLGKSILFTKHCVQEF